jgi:hypothetical protein
MANFPPVFKNNIGRMERLLPSDGGLEIDVIDCAGATSAVSLFSTVDNTGSLSLFGAWNGTAAVGIAGSTFAFGGSVTVATNLTVTTNTILRGDVDLGDGAGDDISIVGSVDTDIVFENSGARNITLDSQTLTIEVTTVGKLQLDGASEVELNGLAIDVNATGAVAIDAVTASNFTVSGAAADLTLGARATTITLNDAANTTLDALFTATSLIGAINEVKTANAGNSTPVFAASEIITAGQVLYVDWDAGNARVGVYIADNTAPGKQNPIGVAINGGIIGADIYIATQGQNVVVNSVIGATTEGAPAYLTTTGGVTLTPPSTSGHTSQIIGTVTKSGGAGVAEIIVQMFGPITI